VNAGFLKVIRETLSIAPLHVWAVAFLSLPFSLIGQYNRYGLLDTIITQLVWLFAVWMLPRIAKKLFPAKNGDYLKQNLAIISLVLFLVTPTVYWIHSIRSGDIYGFQDQVTAHLFSAFSVTILLLASSVILSLRKDGADVFEYLSSAIKDKDLQNLIDTGVRANNESEYGQYLHATVQSQLLACKLLLLKAAQADFTLFPPEITHQINQRLEQIQQPYERPAARIPLERVSELATSWAGLSEVTFNLSPEMSKLNSNSDVISQLIEESVINAIRHGNATRIHIEGISSEELSTFVISDNGHLEAAPFSGGLGTILFNAFAESWSINREGDQTILKFSVRN
jgi:signal transduction histidine kinase